MSLLCLAEVREMSSEICLLGRPTTAILRRLPSIRAAPEGEKTHRRDVTSRRQILASRVRRLYATCAWVLPLWVRNFCRWFMGQIARMEIVGLILSMCAPLLAQAPAGGAVSARTFAGIE